MEVASAAGEAAVGREAGKRPVRCMVAVRPLRGTEPVGEAGT